jgi:hypothetical protein
MKTKAQQKRRKPYWPHVIRQAAQRKKQRKPAFTSKQKRLAKAWLSCACGKLDKRIPKELDGAPKDCRLFSLGIDFAMAVARDNPQGALDLLRKIQKREAELLKELGNKPKAT